MNISFLVSKIKNLKKKNPYPFVERVPGTFQGFVNAQMQYKLRTKEEKTIRWETYNFIADNEAKSP